jgi:hypothetical protein
MNADTVGKIAAAAAASGLDAIIAASPENFVYLAGFLVPSHHVLRRRHAMLVVRPDASVTALTVDMEAATVAGRLPGVPLTVWGEFTDSAMAVLADAAFGSGGKDWSPHMVTCGRGNRPVSMAGSGFPVCKGLRRQRNEYASYARAEALSEPARPCRGGRRRWRARCRSVGR